MAARRSRARDELLDRTLFSQMPEQTTALLADREDPSAGRLPPEPRGAHHPLKGQGVAIVPAQVQQGITARLCSLCMNQRSAAVRHGCKTRQD